jgi:hypothetical protein
MSYTVRGRDGNDHVVDIGTLRQWASERRVTPEYQVFSHSTNAWRLAGQLPELSDVFITAASTNSRSSGSGAAGCLAAVGIVLLFIYPPLGFLLMFIALVVAVVFRSK